MIKIKNLKVVLDRQTILDNANLDIKKGKRTVIVGESGSGKSVLVKSIMGLLQPTSGEIEIEGINLNKAKGRQVLAIKKNISMLFQSSALLDSLSVYQNVALPLFEHHRELKETDIKEIVKQKLAMVGLHNVTHKMPSELSGGMQKRVALARAITLDPLYIIYDEPTTGLDPITAKGIIDLINAIHDKGGFTSIIITHDKDCVRENSDVVAHLINKKIEFYENPKDYVWAV